MLVKTRNPLLMNLTWAVLALFVLGALYVGGLGIFAWLEGRGDISVETYLQLEQSVYFPVAWYCDTERPGHQSLVAFYRWCADPAQR